MISCAIRYRFDGPGPASFLVEHGGTLRIYRGGVLSAPLSDVQVTAMLTDRGRGWVPVSGEVVLDDADDYRLETPGSEPVDDGEVVIESA